VEKDQRDVSPLPSAAPEAACRRCLPFSFDRETRAVIDTRLAESLGDVRLTKRNAV
jgi:hypothetical protein